MASTTSLSLQSRLLKYNPFHLPGQPCTLPSPQLSGLPHGWHSEAFMGPSQQQPGVVFTSLFCCFPAQLGSPQQKPKRLRLVVDVSGSMYRFNGVDGRLERSMEAMCMVMEAFENYEEKFKVWHEPRLMRGITDHICPRGPPT